MGGGGDESTAFVGSVADLAPNSLLNFTKKFKILLC